jgi:putative transposase
MKAAIETLDSIVIKRPNQLKYSLLQHLCLDKGYDFPEIEDAAIKRRYVPHIRRRGEKKKKKKKKQRSDSGKSRRWVVERTNSWHNRFRKLFIRYEKKSEENYLGLVQFACCIIIYRRLILG